MADIQPLRALHYDLARVGPLDQLIAPPYDVIDEAERADLAALSPHNVVHVDLPEGEDRYAAAARTLDGWLAEGAVTRDPDLAVWVLAQDYVEPGGGQRTRHGFFARVRVEEYGPGRIRPHERTHPGPKEDRLRLTRATRTNLSPIFSLFSDPYGLVREALTPLIRGEPWGEAVDAQATTSRLWRVAEPTALDAVVEAMTDSELLIADGHHRYETARVYADEIGGEGGHSHVLMCLVALEDPGLCIFPTHRLLRGLDESGRERLRDTLSDAFEMEEVDPDSLVPEPGEGVRMGYLDAHHQRALRLTLRSPEIAARVLPDRSEAYRELDTAVLEALVLKGALEMTEDDISHLRGLAYARSDAEALALIETGEYEAAFFMGPTPVERVREIAAAGESMPPKSTFFHPKVPTGLLFNPLGED